MEVTPSALAPFQSVRPGATAAEATGLWQTARARAAASSPPPASALDPTPMESGLSVVESLDEAPPRTMHLPSIVRSSPGSPAVRAMLERREFGRRHDVLGVDVVEIADRLPGLECREGDVPFLADSTTFDDFSFSVDCLLSHRKRLVAPSRGARQPRRSGLVFGAGPGGLMTAIQLSLREHRVVVCEQREAYTRNRFIGVYKDVAHLLASLGLPESMTYDFTHYRGKRGVMLADLQTFLHAVALKLGVIIYTGAVAGSLTAEGLGRGEVDLVRSAGRGTTGGGVGLTRWHLDSVARVSSGVEIGFDTVVDATGGRAGLRELLVGRENVVRLLTLAREAAAHDPSLDSFFDDPADHCADFVESDYGCPPGLRRSFAAALRDESSAIPDEIPCFVSNIDASVLTTPIEQGDRAAGVTARIGEQDLDIPPDWVVVECPLTDGRLTRYQIEGPLPQTFDFGGRRLSTRESLDRLNPLSLLVRVLYAMGVPFGALDRRQLVSFYNLENRHADASDVVATWVGRFHGLRVGGDRPIWTGTVLGSDGVRYAIVGEALQNAWYRFGVGVDDTFAGATRFVAGLELPSDERLLDAQRFEKVMLARSVQVIYHLYAVAQHLDQGVVGPVLTEYHINEQHRLAVTEAGLREEAQDAVVMIAAEGDVAGFDHLLDAGLAHHIERCCFRVLSLLEDMSYDTQTLRRAAHALRVGSVAARAAAFAALDAELAASHRKLLLPLVQRAQRTAPLPRDGVDERRREERIIELGLGRSRWAGPWLRACALRVHDPSSPPARAGLSRAAADADPLVAETAAATLSGHGGGHLTIDKVEMLAKVDLFATIPHETLAGLAPLLTERRAVSEEKIFGKGEVGDCLYLVVSGRVRVHHGERVLRHLGPHQYFGELSVLDDEVRSADVTAVEPTHLFRLDQDDFYALMTERAEIAQAVSRVLCEQLRSTTAGYDSGNRGVPAPTS